MSLFLNYLITCSFSGGVLGEICQGRVLGKICYGVKCTKLVKLVVEGLSSTGPTPSSLLVLVLLFTHVERFSALTYSGFVLHCIKLYHTKVQ